MKNKLTEILENFDVNYIGDLQEYHDIIDQTNNKYNSDKFITLDEVGEILTQVADINYEGQTIPKINKIISAKIKSQKRRNKKAMNNIHILKENNQKPITINQTESVPNTPEISVTDSQVTPESSPSIHVFLFLILAAYAFGIVAMIALAAAPVIAILVAIQHNISKQAPGSQQEIPTESGVNPAVCAQT